MVPGATRIPVSHQSSYCFQPQFRKNSRKGSSVREDAFLVSTGMTWITHVFTLGSSQVSLSINSMQTVLKKEEEHDSCKRNVDIVHTLWKWTIYYLQIIILRNNAYFHCWKWKYKLGKRWKDFIGKTNETLKKFSWRRHYISVYKCLMNISLTQDNIANEYKSKHNTTLKQFHFKI